MDEEENFAKLLSQSTTAAAPSWNTPNSADDPWANPFSDTPSTNPFASPFGTSSAYVPAPTADPYTATSAIPDSPRDEISPYVSKIEEDGIGGLGRGQAPDMPSVLAAREQAGFTSPTSPPISAQTHQPEFTPFQHSVEQAAPTSASPRKGLPSDLIDEDLLAASDPSLSLKKAFVKSTNPTPAKKVPESRVEDTGKKAYVFTPSKKPNQSKAEAVPEAKQVKPAREDTEKSADNSEAAPAAVSQTDIPASNGSTEETEEEKQEHSTPKQASSVPLPESNLPTPTNTRPASPSPTAQPISDIPEPSPAALLSPIGDRVAVSPLDGPSSEADYGFQSLSIGASSVAPPPPSKSPVRDVENQGWQPEKTITPPGSRFGGKGWGAMDDEDDGGLFGKGGPNLRSADSSNAWGGETSEGGWGEPGLDSLQSPIAGPSTSTDSIDQNATPPPPSLTRLPSSASTPRTPKLLSKPMFQIAVGDPTRMGDPVRGYTVYTVKTKTTSPHYRRGEFSVLRRFSDFLWLFETLTMNNPGVIVPPVPDKHPFGRFQDTFIETRRLALQRCLNKITAHPVLQLDPDLRLFLESDHFATESKSRRAEFAQDAGPAGNKGLLSGWTGPKFVEQDEWFDSRRSFLDALESQLKGLSKSIETAGKMRLDMAIAMGEFANSVTQLAESDLGSAMCSALARLADLATREREVNEEQAKAEVVNLLNLSDEYVRFIGSVRLAFASRIKCYEKWQNAEREVHRLRGVREKARQQGKLGDRGQQSLAEIGDAERKSRDSNAEFDAVSKLVKSEFGRFEKERVEEFKRVLEKYLDGMIVKQKELIEAWEEYHGVVLGMVHKAQGSGQSR